MKAKIRHLLIYHEDERQDWGSTFYKSPRQLFSLSAASSSKLITTGFSVQCGIIVGAFFYYHKQGLNQKQDHQAISIFRLVLNLSVANLLSITLLTPLSLVELIVSEVSPVFCTGWSLLTNITSGSQSEEISKYFWQFIDQVGLRYERFLTA